MASFESWWVFRCQSLKAAYRQQSWFHRRQQGAETRVSSAAYGMGRVWWKLLGLSPSGLSWFHPGRAGGLWFSSQQCIPTWDAHWIQMKRALLYSSLLFHVLLISFYVWTAVHHVRYLHFTFLAFPKFFAGGEETFIKLWQISEVCYLKFYVGVFIKTLFLKANSGSTWLLLTLLGDWLPLENKCMCP